MKFVAIAAIAAALLGFAQADLGYQFFDQQSRSGNSVSGSFSINVCTPMPSGWNDRVRSIIIANSETDRSLTFYNDAGCSGISKNYGVPKSTFFYQDAIPTTGDKQWSSFKYTSS